MAGRATPTPPPGARARQVHLAPLQPGAAAAAARPSRLWATRTRAAAEGFFHDAGVRGLLHDFASELALCRPADPRKFLYAKLQRELAAEGKAEEGNEERAPALDGQTDSLRVHTECRAGGSVRRDYFVRLAPAQPCPPGAAAETPAAAGARFTSWKTEALAAVTRVVHEAAGATSVSAAMSADEAPAQRAAPACTPSPIAPEIVHLEEAFKAASTAAAAAASRQGEVEAEIARLKLGASATPEASAPPSMQGGNDCHALASLRQSRESDILDLLDAALAQEPREIFERAGKAAGEQLSFRDLQLAFGSERNEEVLRALFEDFDTDQNSHVSIDEFKTGLQHLRLLMAEHDILDGVVDSLGLGEIFKRSLAQFVRQRRHVDDKTVPIDAPIDADAVAKYLREADLEAALQNCVPGVRPPLLRELALLLSQDQVPALETNTKFVPGTFEGVFGDMEEFRRGVIDIVGLPAARLWEAMKLQCCDSVDSKEVFSVTNNGGYSTTPQEEWEFVVNPQMSKEYPGGRVGVKLVVLMIAHCAYLRNGGETLDMALDEADARLIEVCEKNGCSVKDMIDSVKGVLLRKAKEALMSVDPLDLAIQTLKSEGGALEHGADTIKGLEDLKLLAHKLEKVRHELDDALDKAPRVPSTGEISFSAVASKMQHVLSLNMLEALVLYARRILTAAQVGEEEVFDRCRLRACAAFASHATHRALTFFARTRPTHARARARLRARARARARFWLRRKARKHICKVSHNAPACVGAVLTCTPTEACGVVRGTKISIVNTH